jgi:hypothetical protein
MAQWCNGATVQMSEMPLRHGAFVPLRLTLSTYRAIQKIPFARSPHSVAW